MSCPSNAQKRIFQRLNKTMTASKLTVTANSATNHMATLKKIVNISSLAQPPKKALLKYLQTKRLDQQLKQPLIYYARSVLDNDKQKALSEDLDALGRQETQPCASVFKILKELVVSPAQKGFIVKIEKQLQEDQRLEQEIREAQQALQAKKNKKLIEYQRHKSGQGQFLKNRRVVEQEQAKGVQGQQSCKSLRMAEAKAEHQQNKLMRANQKLNQLSASNQGLRERVNQLRKEKGAMEAIYSKLKSQLEQKKENVQKTIKFAGDAYCSRNKAEDDLRGLKEQSQLRKEQFRDQCQRLNNQIQHDLRFKQFIRSKQVQRGQLEQLQKEIQQNQGFVEQKRQENARAEQQYRRSLQKQAQILSAFQKIRRQVGLPEGTDSKQLLTVFANLYQKNAIMKQFVRQVGSEVDQLQTRIDAKRQEMKLMYLRGSVQEGQSSKLAQEHQRKFQLQLRKKEVLEKQIKNSAGTLETIRKYLMDIFEEVGVGAETSQKLKNCTFSEENISQFLGELQRRGLQAIAHYGKLVSQQLRAQKGANWQVQRQIDQLSNIITLDNVNAMNTASGGRAGESPVQLLGRVKQQKMRQDEGEKAYSTQEFRKFAMQSLQQFQKGMAPKQKHVNKKYNIAPVMSKNKKK